MVWVYWFLIQIPPETLKFAADANNVKSSDVSHPVLIHQMISNKRVATPVTTFSNATTLSSNDRTHTAHNTRSSTASYRKNCTTRSTSQFPMQLSGTLCQQPSKSHWKWHCKEVERIIGVFRWEPTRSASTDSKPAITDDHVSRRITW